MSPFRHRVGTYVCFDICNAKAYVLTCKSLMWSPQAASIVIIMRRAVNFIVGRSLRCSSVPRYPKIFKDILWHRGICKDFCRYPKKFGILNFSWISA